MASASKVAPDGHAVISVSASARKGVLKSSNGLDMNEGEVEMFAGLLKECSRTKEKKSKLTMIKEYLLKLCCGPCLTCCQCSKPTGGYTKLVLITNKRIVIREIVDSQDPGKKFCCYYLCCCWCLPIEKTTKKQLEYSFNLADLKEIRYGDDRAVTKFSLCGRLVLGETVVDDTFMDLLIVKKVGDFMPSFYDWRFEKDNKTAWTNVELDGKLPEEKAAELGRVLRTALAANDAARDAMLMRLEGGAAGGLTITNQ